MDNLATSIVVLLLASVAALGHGFFSNAEKIETNGESGPFSRSRFLVFGWCSILMASALYMISAAIALVRKNRENLRKREAFALLRKTSRESDLVLATGNEEDDTNLLCCIDLHANFTIDRPANVDDCDQTTSYDDECDENYQVIDEENDDEVEEEDEEENEKREEVDEMADADDEPPIILTYETPPPPPPPQEQIRRNIEMGTRQPSETIRPESRSSLARKLSESRSGSKPVVSKLKKTASPMLVWGKGSKSSPQKWDSEIHKVASGPGGLKKDKTASSVYKVITQSKTSDATTAFLTSSQANAKRWMLGVKDSVRSQSESPIQPKGSVMRRSGSVGTSLTRGAAKKLSHKLSTSTDDLSSQRVEQIRNTEGVQQRHHSLTTTRSKLPVSECPQSLPNVLSSHRTIARKPATKPIPEEDHCSSKDSSSVLLQYQTSSQKSILTTAESKKKLSAACVPSTPQIQLASKSSEMSGSSRKSRSDHCRLSKTPHKNLIEKPLDMGISERRSSKSKVFIQRGMDQGVHMNGDVQISTSRQPSVKSVLKEEPLSRSASRVSASVKKSSVEQEYTRKSKLDSDSMRKASEERGNVRKLNLISQTARKDIIDPDSVKYSIVEHESKMKSNIASESNKKISINSASMRTVNTKLEIVSKATSPLGASKAILIPQPMVEVTTQSESASIAVSKAIIIPQPMSTIPVKTERTSVTKLVEEESQVEIVDVKLPRKEVLQFEYEIRDDFADIESPAERVVRQIELPIQPVRDSSTSSDSALSRSSSSAKSQSDITVISENTLKSQKMRAADNEIKQYECPVKAISVSTINSLTSKGESNNGSLPSSQRKLSKSEKSVSKVPKYEYPIEDVCSSASSECNMTKESTLDLWDMSEKTSESFEKSEEDMCKVPKLECVVIDESTGTSSVYDRTESTNELRSEFDSVRGSIRNIGYGDSPRSVQKCDYPPITNSSFCNSGYMSKGTEKSETTAASQIDGKGNTKDDGNVMKDCGLIFPIHVVSFATASINSDLTESATSRETVVDKHYRKALTASKAISTDQRSEASMDMHSSIESVTVEAMSVCDRTESVISSARSVSLNNNQTSEFSTDAMSMTTTSRPSTPRQPAIFESNIQKVEFHEDALSITSSLYSSSTRHGNVSQSPPDDFRMEARSSTLSRNSGDATVTNIQKTELPVEARSSSTFRNGREAMVTNFPNSEIPMEARSNNIFHSRSRNGREAMVTNVQNSELPLDAGNNATVAFCSRSRIGGQAIVTNWQNDEHPIEARNNITLHSTSRSGREDMMSNVQNSEINTYTTTSAVQSTSSFQKRPATGPNVQFCEFPKDSGSRSTRRGTSTSPMRGVKSPKVQMNEFPIEAASSTTISSIKTMHSKDDSIKIWNSELSMVDGSSTSYGSTATTPDSRMVSTTEKSGVSNDARSSISVHSRTSSFKSVRSNLAPSAQVSEFPVETVSGVSVDARSSSSVHSRSSSHKPMRSNLTPNVQVSEFPVETESTTTLPSTIQTKNSTYLTDVLLTNVEINKFPIESVSTDTFQSTIQTSASSYSEGVLQPGVQVYEFPMRTTTLQSTIQSSVSSHSAGVLQPEICEFRMSQSNKTLSNTPTPCKKVDLLPEVNEFPIEAMSCMTIRSAATASYCSSSATSANIGLDNMTLCASASFQLMEDGVSTQDINEWQDEGSMLVKDSISNFGFQAGVTDVSLYCDQLSALNDVMTTTTSQNSLSRSNSDPHTLVGSRTGSFGVLSSSAASQSSETCVNISAKESNSPVKDKLKDAASSGSIGVGTASKDRGDSKRDVPISAIAIVSNSTLDSASSWTNITREVSHNDLLDSKKSGEVTSIDSEISSRMSSPQDILQQYMRGISLRPSGRKSQADSLFSGNSHDMVSNGMTSTHSGEMLTSESSTSPRQSPEHDMDTECLSRPNSSLSNEKATGMNRKGKEKSYTGSSRPNSSLSHKEGVEVNRKGTVKPDTGSSRPNSSLSNKEAVGVNGKRKAKPDCECSSRPYSFISDKESVTAKKEKSKQDSDAPVKNTKASNSVGLPISGTECTKSTASCSSSMQVEKCETSTYVSHIDCENEFPATDERFSLASGFTPASINALARKAHNRPKSPNASSKPDPHPKSMSSRPVSKASSNEQKRGPQRTTTKCMSPELTTTKRMSPERTTTKHMSPEPTTRPSSRKAGNVAKPIRKQFVVGESPNSVFISIDAEDSVSSNAGFLCDKEENKSHKDTSHLNEPIMSKSIESMDETAKVTTKMLDKDGVRDQGDIIVSLLEGEHMITEENRKSPEPTDGGEASAPHLSMTSSLGSQLRTNINANSNKAVKLFGLPDVFMEISQEQVPSTECRANEQGDKADLPDVNVSADAGGKYTGTSDTNKWTECDAMISDESSKGVTYNSMRDINKMPGIVKRIDNCLIPLSKVDPISDCKDDLSNKPLNCTSAFRTVKFTSTSQLPDASSCNTAASPKSSTNALLMKECGPVVSPRPSPTLILLPAVEEWSNTATNNWVDEFACCQNNSSIESLRKDSDVSLDIKRSRSESNERKHSGENLKACRQRSVDELQKRMKSQAKSCVAKEEACQAMAQSKPTGPPRRAHATTSLRPTSSARQAVVLTLSQPASTVIRQGSPVTRPTGVTARQTGIASRLLQPTGRMSPAAILGRRSPACPPPKGRPSPLRQRAAASCPSSPIGQPPISRSPLRLTRAKGRLSPARGKDRMSPVRLSLCRQSPAGRPPTVPPGFEILPAAEPAKTTQSPQSSTPTSEPHT